MSNEPREDLEEEIQELFERSDELFRRSERLADITPSKKVEFKAVAEECTRLLEKLRERIEERKKDAERFSADR